MEKLIKNVKPGSWNLLKVEAAKHGFTIGEFLSYLLENHVNAEKKKSNWDNILNKKPSITKEEAKKMEKAIEVFEKEYDFEG